MRDWRIVFDLDDTLYPEADFVKSGFAAVATWIEEEVGKVGFLDATLKIFESGERKHVFDRAIEKCGIPDREGLISDMIAIYREHKPNISVLPEGEWILRRFSGRPLGLITDGYADVQERKVLALGVRSYFQSIVYSDTWGRSCWKPSRFPYEQTMRNLGGAPDEFVYIGDNPEKDFVAAKELGWLAVQVSRVGGFYQGLHVPQTHSPHVVISSLAEVEAVLDSADELRSSGTEKSI